MNERELNTEYFDWMYQLVYDKRYSQRKSYRKLLAHLHSIDFNYIIGMDGNRAEDGIDLRYRFGYEQNFEEAVIADLLDIHPCSVLEMMIALSLRCEENIMDDPDIGDRTGKWFWSMVVNLGLQDITDDNYREHYVEKVIDKFLHRDYGSDGKGGLFYIPNCKRDMRNVEIWCQAMWYLDEVLN